MRRGRLRMLGAAGAAAAVAMMAGCAPAASGHLVLDGGIGVCGDSDTMRAATIGIPVTNEGPGDAVIDGISSGITGRAEQTGAWIVPPMDDDRPTFLGDAPPDADFIDWGSRVDAEGATIAEDASAYLVIELDLEDGETTATLSQITVSFDDGRQATTAAGTFLKVEPETGVCQLD